MSEPLLTARQVADLLGVSAETILRWTRRGDVPAIRLPGGALRYRPAAIEAWLKERATGATVEELSDTPSRPRRGREYPDPIPSIGSDTRPSLTAVTNEEEHHAR